MNASMHRTSLRLAALCSTLFFVNANTFAAAQPIAANANCSDGGSTCPTEGVNFTAAATLTVNNGVNIGATAGASATTTANGQGVIDFLGASTPTGTIGLAGGGGTGLSAINIKGTSSASPVVMNFDWNATTISTTATTGILSIGASKTLTGALTNAGQLSLNANTLTLTGSYTDSGSGTLQSTITGGTVPTVGFLNVSGAATVSAGSKLAISFAGSDSVATGTVLTVLTKGGAGSITAPTTIIGSTATYGISTTGTDANNLKVTITRTPFGTNTPNASLINLADFLNSIAPTASTSFPALAPLTQNLEQLQQFALEDALYSLAPTVDGSMTLAALTHVEQGIHSAQRRMEHLRDGMQPVGYASGDWNEWDRSTGPWLQTFGSKINQNMRNQVPGYYAWDAGIAGGYDHYINKNMTVGVGGTYAYTAVASKGITNNKQHIQTYQGFLYGEWLINDGLYWDAIVSLAYERYNTARFIQVAPAGTAPGISAEASGNFGGWQAALWTEMGYDFVIRNNWLVSPHINYKFSHLEMQKDQESGAGSYNLITQYNNTNASVLGLGVKAGYFSEFDINTTLMPYILCEIYEDFITNQETASSHFFGGGTVDFLVPGIQQPATTYVFGGGVELANIENWFASINYDRSLRKDYKSNEGWIKFKWMW